MNIGVDVGDIFTFSFCSSHEKAEVNDEYTSSGIFLQESASWISIYILQSSYIHVMLIGYIMWPVIGYGQSTHHILGECSLHAFYRGCIIRILSQAQGIFLEMFVTPSTRGLLFATLLSVSPFLLYLHHFLP